LQAANEQLQEQVAAAKQDKQQLRQFRATAKDQVRLPRP
jgi:hypothetical protein